MGCHILDDGFYIWTLHNALTQVLSSLISAPTYYYSTMHLPRYTLFIDLIQSLAIHMNEIRN